MEIIEHPPHNPRRSNRKPLSVDRHVDTTVYGLTPPRYFKDKYVSARAQGAREVFARIKNRPVNNLVEDAVNQWINEFEKHDCYRKREVLYRALLKGDKGRARDRSSCVQEVLYQIQVTHRKLFTPAIIAVARKFAKTYAYSEKADPFDPNNGWLGF